MYSLILYIGKSGAALIVFYAFYRFFLYSETYFTINRRYLQLAVLTSMILPFQFFKMNVTDNGNLYTVLLDAVTINEIVLVDPVAKMTDFSYFLVYGYIAVSSFLLLRLAAKVIKLLMLIRKSGITYFQNSKIVFTDQKIAPFSFFNLIFIHGESINTNYIHEIIEHEKVHIRQWHSLDILLIEMLIVLQWFNPVVWRYRKSLKLLHEYIADDGVLKKGYNSLVYQNLLLTLSVGFQVSGLTNNFNHSLIKNRIVMMTKPKSGFAARLKVLLAAPLALILALFLNAVSTVPITAQTEQLQPQKIEDREAKGLNSEKNESAIFTVVDQMPKYPGGDEALVRFLIENIKYPEAARKAGKQGVVFVSFVVEKNGKISNANVIRGFDTECDDVALKTVQAMPDWIAGKQNGDNVRVQFTLPIRFNLGNEQKEDKSD